jgi:hypothetical protein
MKKFQPPQPRTKKFLTAAAESRKKMEIFELPPPIT